jgi:hypothetical protein
MTADGVDILMDYKREESGRVLRVRVLSVPASEKYPDGVKYRFHYGTTDGDTIVRYDNSHGYHERHVGETVERIEFPDDGFELLYRRFMADVEALSTDEGDNE